MDKKAGNKYPSSGPRRRTRRPSANHARQPRQGISGARALKVWGTTNWNSSTLAVRFLPKHNIQNHSRGAIRILRSNYFRGQPSKSFEQKIRPSLCRGVQSKTPLQGTRIDAVRQPEDSVREQCQVDVTKGDLCAQLKIKNSGTNPSPVASMPP